MAALCQQGGLTQGTETYSSRLRQAAVHGRPVPAERIDAGHSKPTAQEQEQSVCVCARACGRACLCVSACTCMLCEPQRTAQVLRKCEWRLAYICADRRPVGAAGLPAEVCSARDALSASPTAGMHLKASGGKKPRQDAEGLPGFIKLLIGRSQALQVSQGSMLCQRRFERITHCQHPSKHAVGLRLDGLHSALAVRAKSRFCLQQGKLAGAQSSSLMCGLSGAFDTAADSITPSASCPSTLLSATGKREH